MNFNFNKVKYVSSQYHILPSFPSSEDLAYLIGQNGQINKSEFLKKFGNDKSENFDESIKQLLSINYIQKFGNSYKKFD